MAKLNRANIRQENLRIIKKLSQTLTSEQAEQLRMDLYNRIGELLVRKVKAEMLIPRMRYSKRPRMAKAIQYNTRASGDLYRSVRYELRLDEEDQIQIDLLMLDYGVDNVYGDGSFPGSGNWAKDTRPKEARASRSALIEALTKWASAKLGLGGAQARSMAFAVRKNLFKYGYGGIELLTPALQSEITNRSLELINRAPFDALPVGEELRSLFDRVNTFGNKTYSLFI
jgi:hypothetical protein